MKKPTILVVGAHGMVGQAVYRYLVSNPSLVAFGTTREGSRTSLKLSVASAEKDIEAIYKKMGTIDFIINCIGVVKKDAAIQSLVRTNSWFPHLLENITKRKYTRLIHISTDAVFGKLQGKVTEKTTPFPDTLYGMSKLLGETEQNHALTIRTSFIGHNANTGTGIIESVLSGKKQIDGYSNQTWSGCTTVQFAQLCELLTNTVTFENIRKKTAFIHFSPLPIITKYMLAKKIVIASELSLPVRKVKKEKITRFLYSLFPFFTSSYEKALKEIIKIQSPLCIVCKKKMYKMFPYRGFTYYKCSDCSHVSTLPYPRVKDMQKHYAKKFQKGNYQLLHSFKNQYNTIYEGMIAVLEKQLQKEKRTLKGLSVLDIGCFTGEFLVLLQKKGVNVYGLELQKDAVRIANKNLPGRVKETDVMHDAFPKKRFDIITLLGVVEHVTDPLLLLHQSHALLKKGGLLIIQTPNSSSYVARVFEKYWPPFEPVEHIHLFGEKSMKKALEKTGFTVESFQPHWKKLPVQYVYNMLENFGPEIHRLIQPFSLLFRKIPKNVTLPFYVGEMLLIAKKK